MGPFGSSIRACARGANPVALYLVVGLLAGCDIPAAPNWEVGAQVPFESERFTATDYLPDDVIDTVIAGQPAFVVKTQQASTDFTLGQMCSFCAPLQGQTVPVPTFDFTDSLDVLFPNDIASIGVSTSTLTFRLRNDFGFDPLRPHPNPDSAGFIALVARDIGTGALVDSVLVSGTSESLPPSTTKSVVLTISNIELTDGVRTVLNIHSPADGQTATVDNALAMNLTTLVEDNIVVGVTAVLDTDTLNENFLIDYDLDVRTDVAGQLQSGVFELELFHTLDVTGNLGVSIAGSTAALFSGTPADVELFAVELAPAPTGRTFTREVAGDLLRFIAELPVIHIGFRAIASGASIDPLGRPTVRLTPNQFLEAKLRLTAIIRVDPG